MPTDKTDITEVLKALNHGVRREIIRLLHDTRSSIPYSRFMDSLKLPASSNLAYHLSLLNKANLINKDSDGKYFLTDLGQRSALMLDLVSDSRKSTFSDLTLAFSRISPFEFLFAAWWLFFLIIGLILFTDARFLLFGLLSVSLGLSFIFLFLYRTRVLWSIILLNNLIWIVFVPNKRVYLFLISLFNLIGLALMFPRFEFSFSTDQFLFPIGLILIFLSVIISLLYLCVSFGISLRNLKIEHL